MGVKVQCPDCGRTANVREVHLGRTIRCNQCQGTYVAETLDDEPRAEASATAHDDDAGPAPAAKAARASATAPEADTTAQPPAKRARASATCRSVRT